MSRVAGDIPTRLTKAFSKKLENHALSIALHYMNYNFCRIHKTLRVTLQWSLASRIACGI